VLRYGEYSKPGEFEYDHPFQWGSRRIGPDLARVGGKYPDHWHYLHFNNPRATSPGSIMPPYPWLLTNTLDTTLTQAKVQVMRKLNVPYSKEDVTNACDMLEEQAGEISTRLEAEGYTDTRDKEIVAIIAYLQRMGKDTQPRPIVRFP
jgi:cytochrome c oxidase cbb3-type subunit I/II